MKHIGNVEIILYVNDQEQSTAFYTGLFRQPPHLEVPGMTAFILGPQCKLGLMPNTGIAKILGAKTPHPAMGNGIPRCELYLQTSDVEFEFSNALRIGAQLISPVKDRNWGDRACYFADPDGHIVAFAEKLTSADEHA